MHRDEDDLQLLAELAGVLDQTVTAAGLSSGTYLVLREVAGAQGVLGIMAVAGRLHSDPNEVADLIGRLVQLGFIRASATGVAATQSGRATAQAIEVDANEAIREYVLDRPHTATVYGLVASMQSGRFTVNDLIDFLQESADEPDGES
jgi:hypothetical protein